MLPHRSPGTCHHLVAAQVTPLRAAHTLTLKHRLLTARLQNGISTATSLLCGNVPDSKMARLVPAGRHLQLRTAQSGSLRNGPSFIVSPASPPGGSMRSSRFGIDDDTGEVADLEAGHSALLLDDIGLSRGSCSSSDDDDDDDDVYGDDDGSGTGVSSGLSGGDSAPRGRTRHATPRDAGATADASAAGAAEAEAVRGASTVAAS